MNKITGIPNKQELVIVSFNITRNLARIQKEWTDQCGATGEGTGRAFPTTSSNELGGEVCLFNPQQEGGRLRYLAKIAVRTPMGLHVDHSQESLYVSSDHYISVVRDGKVVETLDNRLFNCLHGMCPSLHDPEHVVFLASTGIDCILQVDLRNASRELYAWNATSNGFPYSPSGGRRNIDLGRNYQGIEFSTPTHTTHLNSVLNHRDGRVLSTFFHQGELREVDYSNGGSRTVLGGLKNPHAIRRKEDGGFILSDSGNHRVLLLGENLEVVSSIEGDFGWVQDAIELQDGSILLADAGNSRLVRTHKDGAVISSISHGCTMRIGVLEKFNYCSIRAIFGL